MEIAIKLMTIITEIVGIFAIISTMTPNPSDDKTAGTLQQWVNKGWRLINLLGANVGKAKNMDD